MRLKVVRDSPPLDVEGTAGRPVGIDNITIPVHYEGWKHFTQGRAAVERQFAGAPHGFRTSVRWLPIGVPVDLDPPARMPLAER